MAVIAALELHDLVPAGEAARKHRREERRGRNAGQAVADFNKGDAKGWAAACADQTSIIDNIPPYRWDGAGACTAWWNAYQAGAKKGGITEGAVEIAKVRHAEVTGDSAYVVLTANYSDKQKGKSTAENGSSFALVLNKSATGWHIISWSWAAK